MRARGRSGNKESYLDRVLNKIRPKSPCCKKPMTSALDMEIDKLVYECPKCEKEWV